MLYSPPFRHIVPKSLARQQKDPCLGVSVQQCVFAPAHPQEAFQGEDAAACAPLPERKQREPLVLMPQAGAAAELGLGGWTWLWESFVGCPMQSPACPTVLLRQAAGDHSGKSWNFSLSQNESTPSF